MDRVKKVEEMENVLYRSLSDSVFLERILAALSIDQKEDLYEYLITVWDLVPDEEDEDVVPWYQ